MTSLPEANRSECPQPEVVGVYDGALFIPKKDVRVYRVGQLPEWALESLDAEIRRLEGMPEPMASR